MLVILLVAFSYVSSTQLDPTVFLEKYGYMTSHAYSGNTSLEDAIRNMQAYANLPETGVLDDVTIQQMKEPRCGVADISLHYYYGARKWKYLDLTYRLVNYTPDLPRQEVTRIINEAFKVWSDVTPLKFKEATQGGDLNIVFGRRRHRGAWGKDGAGYCNARFDGRGRVLAHAYFPPDGRAHFDEDENFTDRTRSGTNLFWVAAHEFGHALGLSHSRVRGALMYPYYTGYRQDFRLHDDDITRITALYGSVLPPGVTRRPYTRPPTRSPYTDGRTWSPDCVDTRGEKFCKARISVCTTSHDGWRAFMKKYCYKTCFCDGPLTLKPITTLKPVTEVSKTTKKASSETPKQTTRPTGVLTTKQFTTTQQTKITGPQCVDKAGQYCVGHAKRCGTTDPVWKSYLKRNCFKTCFC